MKIKLCCLVVAVCVVALFSGPGCKKYSAKKGHRSEFKVMEASKVIQPPTVPAPQEVAPAPVAEQLSPTPPPQQLEALVPSLPPELQLEGRSVQERAQEINEQYKMAVVEVRSVSAGSGDESGGTGFVIDKSTLPDGRFSYRILTNSHVLDEDQEEEKAWRVILADGSESIEDPKLRGFDPLADIAILEVESSKDLPVCYFGDMVNIKELDDIVAIGNTEGRGVVTMIGQVSKVRTGVSNYDFELIQTDISLNRGNSGSPVFDLGGKVVGVDTFGSSAENSNVSFLVPVDRVKKAYQNILNHWGKEYVTYGTWGVAFQVLPNDVRRAISESASPGAVGILRVLEGSAADRAGLRGGDILLSVNGDRKIVRIEKHLELYAIKSLINDGKKGDVFELEILREGQPTKVSLAVDEEIYGRVAAFHTAYGFTVVNISSDDKKWYKVASPGVWTYVDNSDGDSIHDVLDNKDIITHVNGEPTPAVADFKRAYKKAVESSAEHMVLKTVDTNRNSSLTPRAYGYVLVRL